MSGEKGRPEYEFVSSGNKPGDSILPEGKKLVLVKAGEQVHLQFYGLNMGYSERKELMESFTDCDTGASFVEFAQGIASKHGTQLFIAELRPTMAETEYMATAIPSASSKKGKNPLVALLVGGVKSALHAVDGVRWMPARAD